MLRLVCPVVEYPDVAVKVVEERMEEEEEVEGAGVCAEGERGKEWGVVQCSMQ